MTSRLQSSGIAALSFTLSAALLGLALSPGIASAQSGTVDEIELTARGDRIVEQRRVDASDLDLASVLGMKALDSRVRRAITAVCDEPGVGRNTLAEGRCRHRARLDADRQVASLRSDAIALAAAGPIVPADRDIVVASR